jgi:thiopeptide-type bacteriocin biosynthesis protein
MEGQTVRLESDPQVVLHSVVVADETIRRHGNELVLPHRPGRDGPEEVRLRATGALTAILDLSRLPIATIALLDAVGDLYPDVTRDVVLETVAGLVREGFLHTDVRPPTTGGDPLGHLAAHHHTDVRTVAAAGPGTAVMTDLVTGTQVTVSAKVGRELEQALAVMARISPHPHGTPAWREYRTRFMDAYSLGALVPVTDLTDPAAGIGLPAGYRGSETAATEGAMTGRDEYLLALVQRATAASQREVVLTSADIESLSVANPVQVPSSAAMNVSILARSTAAIDQGHFRVVCGGLSVASGVTLGRFLPLLDPAERTQRIAALTDLPTLDEQGVRVQVSSPALRTRTQNVARSVQAVPDVIAVGEYNPAATIRLADLAVGATTSRMFLIHLPTGRRIEPFVLNALEPVSATHPMARFLCELPRAHTAVMTPFSWGAAASLPFLPAVRIGRAVLSEALWRLERTDLEIRGVSSDYALDVWLDRWEVPDDVFLGAYDQRLRLDLTEPGHQALLLHEVTRHGRVTLTEAPGTDDVGWIGHAHQLTVEFASAQLQATAPEPLAGPVVARRDDVRHPGASRTCLLKIYAPRELATAILDDELRSELARNAGVDDWWFTRYADPADHLRLRLRLRNADDFGAVARHVASWATRARRDGLVNRIRWDEDTPELGRYGSGRVLDAAETFFAADSRAALAESTSAPHGHDEVDGIDPSTWRAAVTVASMVELARAFLGEHKGLDWLVGQLRRDTSAHPERAMQALAVRLAGPDGHTVLGQTPSGQRILASWVHRRDTLARYAARLTAAGTDPAGALGALLHMHHNRVLGIDPDGEALILRAARTVALSRTSRRTRTGDREAVLA